MNAIAKTALALVIVGALNWLLVGAFRFDLVAALLGNMSMLSRIVYGLVGVAGIYCVTLLFQPGASVAKNEYRRAA